jgi:TolA-binding protein
MVDFAFFLGSDPLRARALTLKLGLLALLALASPVVVAAQNVPPAAMNPSNPLEPATARLMTRLDQLERQNAELTGRIEVLEAELAAQKAFQAQKLAEEEAVRASQELATKAAANTTAAPTEAPPTGAPSTGAPSTDAPVADPPPADPSKTVAPQADVLAPEASPLEPKAVPEGVETAQNLFKAAQQSLARGDYGSAETKLTQLLSSFPFDPEALEARWLLGEARFVQSAWGSAAEAYLSYLEAAPEGSRASEALIRLAGAFGQLDNQLMRCSALDQYKRQTTKPDATLKARADAEMARTPCPAT